MRVNSAIANATQSHIIDRPPRTTPHRFILRWLNEHCQETKTSEVRSTGRETLSMLVK